MKKILIFLLVGFIIPQVTFAAWWNPFTWFSRSPSSKSEKIEVAQKEAWQETLSDTQAGWKSPKTPISKLVEESSKETYLELSSLKNYVDILIENYTKNLEYSENIIEVIDFYTEDFDKGKTLSLDAKNHAEPGFDDAWELIISYWEDGLDENDWNKSFFNEVTKHLKKVIMELQEKKTTLSGRVTAEQYLSEYKKIKQHYGDNIDADRDLITRQYNAFESKAKKFHAEIGSYMLDVAERELDYSKPTQSGYNKTVGSSYTYQPISYPIIQMPKTTYCTVSGGLGGHYSMICN